MQIITQKEINVFQKFIWDYYKENKRDLPWRHTTDPYSITLSEIMLQQTQVPRVLVKYQAFIHTFPHFRGLADAPLSQVLELWQGMGYNRRALYLKKIAENVVNNYQGRLPQNYEELISLPGIGKNTAGSILAFAYNIPVVFIETNIRRVFIHHFFKKNLTVDDTEILPFVEITLDRNNPREWYYALMDYGTFLAKTIENPNRKSKHYAKQSPLKGSIREARGRIIKLLTEYKSLSKEELIKKVYVEENRFSKAFNQLKDENFIREKDSIVTIC